MKRSLLSALLISALLTTPAQAAREIPVQVDGTPLSAPSYVERGVSYIPLRSLLDAFGGWTVRWDAARQAAVASSKTHELEANPAQDTLTLNGQVYPAEVSVVRGRTYLPLRLLTETLGGTAEWDPYLAQPHHQCREPGRIPRGAAGSGQRGIESGDQPRLSPDDPRRDLRPAKRHSVRAGGQWHDLLCPLPRFCRRRPARLKRGAQHRGRPLLLRPRPLPRDLDHPEPNLPYDDRLPPTNTCSGWQPRISAKSRLAAGRPLSSP